MGSSVRLLSVVTLLVAPVAAQDVWVVDAAGGPGSDFTDLPSAVAAASDDDTVLVRAGSYTEGFVIDDLKLHVIAEDGADVVVLGQVAVRNNGPFRRAVLRGLRIDNEELMTGPALLLEDNQGTIWIEDCFLEASSQLNPFVSKSGAFIEDCDEVVMVRCDVSPAGASSFFAEGLSLIRSSVHLYATEVASDPEMPGARLQDSFLLSSGCTFTGGDGLDGMIGPFGPCAGDGGPGIYLQSGANELVLTATTAVGGAPGEPSDQCSDLADPGEPVQVASGTVDEVAGPARGIAFDAPASEGSSTTLSVEGAAGDVWFLLIAAAPDPFYAPAFGGSLLPAQPVVIVPFGALPPSGATSLELPVPALAPGAESVTFFTQGAFLGTGGERRTGAGSALSFLAAGL